MDNSNQKITVYAIVKLPIKTVWESWTEPQHIVNWNFASDDWHSPNSENDLKVGGSFLSRMEAKDGSIGFDFEGKYTKVEGQKTIEYVMADSREVSISFEDLGKSTKVTETFDPENTHPLEFQKAGWQAILDNFKKYTETL